MIYQFENDEIKKCIRCPMWVFPEMATMPLCNLTGETIPKGSTPQDNDCPLVAISKTETTSAKKIIVDVQLRPLLNDLEVDIDDIKEYISKLD